MAKRKVKAKKITKILFGVILIVAILAGGSFYYIYNFSKKKPEPQVVEKKEEVKKEQPKEEKKGCKSGFVYVTPIIGACALILIKTRKND